MHNQISIRSLLLLAVVSALFLAVFRELGSNQFLFLIYQLALLIFCLVSVHAVLFTLVWLIKRVDMLTEPDEPPIPQSPFATDRLPSQLVPPSSNGTRE